MHSFVLEISQVMTAPKIQYFIVSIAQVYNNRYYREYHDDKLTISWAKNSEWVHP